MIHLNLHCTILLICLSSAVVTTIPIFDNMESSIVQILGNTTNAVSFAQFAQTYKKKYKSIKQMKHRFGIYLKRLELIESTNKKNLSYTLGVNEMADWSWKEIKQYRTGLKIPGDFSVNRKVNYTFSNQFLPERKDWRDEGIVSPVKNQGSRCKCCYAFSATGAMEAAYSQAYQRGITFSEQQLIDCSGSVGNLGCEGGRIDKTFQYIINAGGISTDLEYPYTGSQGPCQFQPSMIAGVLQQYNILPYQNEDSLKDALVTLRPVTVAFTSQGEFNYYRGGIYSKSDCGNTIRDNNHGMVAVGYGVENGVPYWILKNSWGTEWGEQGYARVLMGKNMCGIANFAVVPSL